MIRIKNIIIYLRVLLLIPGINWNDNKFCMDLDVWIKICEISGTKIWCLAWLLWYKPEFRNLYIYRNTSRLFYRILIKILYRPMNTLYIETKNIGGGLFIQHGFATMISADSIGENCWINQQVTIGFNGAGKPPIIKDNVQISCGAKVLGEIVIEDNAVIGANAVVVKNVEKGAVMVGVPAKRIR